MTRRIIIKRTHLEKVTKFEKSLLQGRKGFLSSLMFHLKKRSAHIKKRLLKEKR